MFRYVIQCWDRDEGWFDVFDFDTDKIVAARQVVKQANLALDTFYQIWDKELHRVVAEAHPLIGGRRRPREKTNWLKEGF